MQFQENISGSYTHNKLLWKKRNQGKIFGKSLDRFPTSLELPAASGLVELTSISPAPLPWRALNLKYLGCPIFRFIDRASSFGNLPSCGDDGKWDQGGVWRIKVQKYYKCLLSSSEAQVFKTWYRFQVTKVNQDHLHSAIKSSLSRT